MQWLQDFCWDIRLGSHLAVMSVLFLVALQQAHFMAGSGFYALLLAHSQASLFGIGWGWDDDDNQMARCASAPRYDGGGVCCRCTVICAS